MRKDWDIDAGRGLWLFRASRLEALVAPLDALLTHLPPTALLAPQTVLVGHPGLRPWLRQRLAACRGPSGIVANLELALPGPWLDGLAQTLLGVSTAATRASQREVLRWRLLPRLGELADVRVQALLDEDDGREAFALAERLSAALPPLMLYRPEWLARWARGREAVAGDALLASAWRLVQASTARGGIGDTERGHAMHRGERLLELARRLTDSESRPEGIADDPLHVFGLHHLAPPELAVLRALSRWRPVVVHVADPCREHWLGMGTGRAAMRAALAGDDLGESAFLALDHPLLAAWGRLGQHFLLALEDDGLALNERHGVDAADAPPRHLLDRLQHSLRANDPTLLRVADTNALAALHDDASLRVTRCATPLRELETLRDALMDAFATLPALQPGEIVVLAPDIARYRPLIPAVFGEAGQRDGAWPWHAADAPLSVLHPLHRALRQALALSGARLTASGALDLLAHEAVARRFGLEGQGEGTLRHALARLGVAWGFDADDRARFGAPADPMHSFDGGLDRAMAGHVFGLRDPEVLTLPDGERLWPGDGVDVGVAAVLGRLHALLLELREWAELGESALAPAAWQATLERRIAALLAVAPGDDEARQTLESALGLVAELHDEWRDAELAAPLPWAAVREALLAKLDAVPERQRFLAGGITFCGMVPQRAIPFRVVAVLGLDEGALPRHARDDGLELRARAPRVGDRDLAADDRYLFLETLMAARDRLHLSFIGVGADDGRPRNPAAPLADLLDTLARFVPPAGTLRPPQGWPWERQAALQPVLPAVRDGVPQGPTAMRDAGPATSDIPMPSLDALLAFFRDPAKQALRDVAGVRLDGLDEDALDDDEPLAPKADPREAMARGLVLAALEQDDALSDPPEAPPEELRLSGRLPPGPLGVQLWREQRAQAMATLAALRKARESDAVPMPCGALSPPRRLALRVAIDATTALEGGIDVREDDAGTLWLAHAQPTRKIDDVHFGHRLPLLLGGLALRLAQERPVRVLLAGKDRVDGLGARWAADDAAFLALTDPDARAAQVAGFQRQLRFALEFRAAALRGEQRYSPATSWAAFRHGVEEPERIVAAWAGSGRSVGERDFAPGYAALWGRDWHFVPGEGDIEAFVRDAQALVAALPALVERDDGRDDDGAVA